MLRIIDQERQKQENEVRSRPAVPLRTETEKITNISENLNRYSDEINSDLSQYTVK